MTRHPIRTPAVAGSFYPGTSAELTESLETLTDRDADTVPAIGIIVPHAGYVYSGAIAGEVFSGVRIPERTILLGPNHTGLGRPLSIMTAGAWETPLGESAIDSTLAAALVGADPDLEEDSAAHRSEHSLEVELPFLQFLRGPGARFVPIVVGTADLGALIRLGEAVATVVRQNDDPILLVASTDMNHYESDAVTRVKDRKAIEAILDRDPVALYNAVLTENISMCGFAPTVAMLTAANRLGAERATMVRYGTSGDIFGERDRVVGYAGIRVE